jgi:hypothetical protein
MTKYKIIVSVIVSTLILFAWYIISWMVLPFHSGLLKNIPEKSINTYILKNTLHGDGVYHYPGLPSDNSPESLKKLNDKLDSGPRITLMVYKSGKTELFNSKSFLLSFLYNLLTSCLTLLVLTRLRVTNRTVVTTTSLITGLIVCFSKILPQSTWYLFPIDYVLIELMDSIVAFFLIGVFFALFTFKNKAK